MKGKFTSKIQLFTLFIIIVSCGTKAIVNTPENDIKRFRQELNDEYRNKESSPLRGDNFTNFKQHPFFPIDLEPV